MDCVVDDASRGVGLGQVCSSFGMKVLVCVCNRVKTQNTPARAPPPVLKMSWDHEPCENSHIELQSFRVEDLEVDEKAIRSWGKVFYGFGEGTQGCAASKASLHF